ncbi:MAG: hypothetical protein P8107_12035, partial [Spirochaetia bacterium]
MFENNSRYAKLKPYTVKDHKGREIQVVPVPPPPAEQPLGRHRRKQGQRLDHLAYKYLNNAEGFWRICEVNDVMLPEALSRADEIIIPKK